jgi:hypothetical protein
MRVTLAPKLLGTCAQRARTYSATLAKNMATESPHSAHASQAVAR